MLLGFIRYMRGYVRFTVRGRFPERFLNITAKKGIRVWDAARHGETISAAMYMTDYLAIRPVARASGVRLSVDGRFGLPTRATAWKGRAGLFVGAFVFILTVFVMSLFIWSIDITGLETLSESEMRSLLSSHGLYIGAFKPAVDFGSVSRAVMLDESKVGWMAVNVTGSYASVEIKEEVTAPDIPDIKQPCNVKASRDAVIITVNAGEGDVLLKEGSGVVEGQLIVSGVMDDMMGGVRLVHAEAEVKAATEYEAEFSIDGSFTNIFPTGEVAERRSLGIPGLSIPLTLGGVSSELVSVNDSYICPCPLETVLPAGIVVERTAALKRETMTLDDNSAEEILAKISRLYEIFTLSCCKVTNREYNFTETNGRYIISIKYTCEENIAVQEPIGIDEGTDRLRPLNINNGD